MPGLSPAEGMATRTMERLTFGLMPDGLSLIVVAAMETTIGFSLLTGRHLRLGLALLGMAMVGVLSPLVLFTGELFAGPYNGPTLTAQYVFKDIVLLAAGLVIAAYALMRHPSASMATRGANEHDGGTPPVRSIERRQAGRRLVEAAVLLALVAGSARGAAAGTATFAADVSVGSCAEALPLRTPIQAAKT